MGTPEPFLALSTQAKISTVLKLILYLIVVIGCAVALSALGNAKEKFKNQKDDCGYDGDYTPCPLTLFEQGSPELPLWGCGGDVSATPCNYIIVVMSVSIILGVGLAVMKFFYMIGKSFGSLSNFVVVELFLSVGMMLALIAAAAVTTDDVSKSCDNLDISNFSYPDGVSTCDDRYVFLYNNKPPQRSGLDDIYTSLLTMQDSAWVATMAWVILTIIFAVDIVNERKAATTPSTALDLSDYDENPNSV